MKMKYLLLSSTLIGVQAFSMGAIKRFCEQNPKLCGQEPEPIPEPPTPHPCEPCNLNNPPECGPLPPECNEPEPQPVDFDWSKVEKYGGPEISIAKDIGTWEITATLHNVGFKGNNLTQNRDAFDPRPCVGSSKKAQGTFNACVKQDDGLYICGSWDYEKCGGQTSGKTLSNLSYGGTMASSFNLHKGVEICFFNSGLARTNERNEKIRTSVFCTSWPY